MGELSLPKPGLLFLAAFSRHEEALVWARVPGDLVFACGVLTFAAFVVQAFRTSREPRDAAAVLVSR